MSPLTSLILTPFIGAVLVLLIPGGYKLLIRAVAVLASLIAAWKAAALFLHFQPGVAALQFEEKIRWVAVGGLNLNYHVALDGLSVGLVLVAALVGFAATAASWEIQNQGKLFYALLLVMIGGIIGAFASLDLFFFYFFNELSLVPTFLMIGLWGRGEQKNFATFQITLYLTLGALVGLVGLIALYANAGANSLDVVDLKAQLAKTPLSPSAQAFIFPCLLFGFGTLVGLWPFHSWAPLGYASAPTPTAMMHAGVLKKAGLYVLLRAALPFMPDAAAQWTQYLALLCLGNLLYCGWVAMRQKDLRLLIGNSSLAHMGFAFLGLASLEVIGVTGAVLVMIAHALLAALSFAVTGWLEQQTQTVELSRLGGLMKRMPFLGSVMVIAFLAGCGVPGFANFAGEITVLFGAWRSFHGIVVVAAWGGLVIGAVYMLRAVRSVLHGPARPEWAAVTDVPNWWRKLPFALLIAVLLLFGCYPSLLVDRIQPTVVEIVKQATTLSQPLPRPKSVAVN